MAIHDETEMTILNNRNIHALHEAMKFERARVDDLLKKVEGANKTVASLHEEINQLRAQLAAIIAMR